MISTPVASGPGDYLAIAGSVSVKGGLLTASADVDVELFAGTAGTPFDVPLTGPIQMKARLPYAFEGANFPVYAGKGIWLKRSNGGAIDNTVFVSGFLTYE